MYTPKIIRSPLFSGDQLEKNGSSFNGEFLRLGKLVFGGVLIVHPDTWTLKQQLAVLVVEKLDDEPKR